MASEITQSKAVRLPDGRSIAYEELGTAGGPAVFVFHGNPGSRLDVFYAGQETLRTSKARLIAPDRPGVGLSDSQTRRRLLDWPADVNSLADALGIGRYAVIGASTGGPYALACARFSGTRLTAAAVLSSLGPPDAPAETHPVGTSGMYFGLARRAPVLLRLQLWLMAQGLHNPERLLAETTKHVPASDQAFLAQPAAQRTFLASLSEGLRNPAGLALDAALVARQWDFQIQDIAVPVHIWHGEDDRNSPVAMGRWLAEAIPDSRARFFQGEGHFSLVGQLGDLVDLLIKPLQIGCEPNDSLRVRIGQYSLQAALSG